MIRKSYTISVWAAFLSLSVMLAGYPDGARAQANGPRFSASTGNASLSAAATALTIQQPALTATPNTIRLEAAVVYCSVACVVNQSQNGAAATATAATIAAINPVGLPPSATAWSASNVGGGTAIPPPVNVAAGGTVIIDLSKIILPKGGPTMNYTVAIAAITGTANISMIWSEQQ